jgi:hypothetical protein
MATKWIVIVLVVLSLSLTIPMSTTAGPDLATTMTPTVFAVSAHSAQTALHLTQA